MAMSRFLTQSLARNPLLQAHPTLNSIHQRHRSGKAHEAQLIEVDIEDGGVEVVGTGMRNLEDALQSLIAKRAAPDWLPFAPGYSYYVPPPPPIPHAGKLFEVLGKLSDSKELRNPSLSRDESLSLTTNLGWPSSTYFIEGTAPTHPMPMGSVVEVNLFDSERAADQSSGEDE